MTEKPKRPFLNILEDDPHELVVHEYIKWCDKRISELEAENLRLRKIAAHVPSKIYIAAKNAAGFAEPIKPRG